MNHMLETLVYPSATQGGENAAVEPISRKDALVIWLAGIIDGEGCISAYWWKQTNPRNPDNHGLRISVSISNTHPDLIRKVSEAYLELGVSFNYNANARKRYGEREKPVIAIIVMGKGRLLKLLPAIIPYLTAKRRQAELALELIVYRESLAIHNRVGTKGRFGGMNLRDDDRINGLIDAIKRDKHDMPSVLNCPRLPNTIFGESSTTLRSPCLGDPEA